MIPGFLIKHKLNRILVTRLRPALQTRTSSGAQNVLNLVYRDTFPVYLDEEDYYLRQQQPAIHLINSKKKTALKSITITPNPANNFITVKAEGMKIYNCEIEIIDITGKRQHISKVEFKQNEFGLDVGFLNSGLYLIRIFDGVQMHLSSKLMIAR
jgi:hypothetical protein